MALTEKDARVIGRAIATFATKRVRPLEERIAALEARPEIKYLGTWDHRASYTAGAMVTHRGSVWSAKADSIGVTPGDGVCWQLAVKRGRDR